MAPGRNSKGKSRPRPTAQRKSKATASKVGEDGAALLPPSHALLSIGMEKEQIACWIDCHAKAQAWKKVKAKGGKAVFHTKIAEVVFNVPEETPCLREWYQRQPDKFASTIVNYLSWLRMGYLDFNTEFGRTGAGLDYSEVTPGSDIRNLIDKLKQEFLYWECLHSYWRTLPNYNPLTVSSEPGQDLEAQAMALLNGEDTGEQEKDDSAHDNIDSSNGLSQEELEELEADPDADAEHPFSATSFSSPSFGSSHNGNSAAFKPPPSRMSKKPSPTPKPPSSLRKHSALVAFGIDNENDAAISASLQAKKYNWDLTSFTLQKTKLDFLAQCEAAEQQCKHEAHELQMMRL
ncbi:hypothetical protein K443DRAFT_10432 [Laccaria amethystina LaAM-08-1]|uniref:Uncharacterized protein n=1 Tax=Laccaria amethystina LaAM-08-1 TaxID=1095629 RepID=A0A0C9XKG1_9AGAR|nr:hypothetical protein K443DRAFT_10432 [Laccaria amethystina LaAM-08-1]